MICGCQRDDFNAEKTKTFQKMRVYKENLSIVIKGTASLAERCDLGGMKLEKVHEFFQVCLNLCRRSCDNMWLIIARYEIKVGQILTDPLI